MAEEEKTAVVLSLVPAPHREELRRRALTNRIIQLLQSDEMDEITDFTLVLRNRKGLERTVCCMGRGGVTTLVGMLERAKFDVMLDHAECDIDSGEMDDEGA